VGVDDHWRRLLRPVLRGAAVSLEQRFDIDTDAPGNCHCHSASRCERCLELGVFRKKDLWLSVVLFLPYPCAAAVLGVLLFLLGSPLRGWFLVYVGYLGFALWWNYRVFTLNVDERRLPR
jgi:hypothetical protein